MAWVNVAVRLTLRIPVEVIFSPSPLNPTRNVVAPSSLDVNYVPAHRAHCVALPEPQHAHHALHDIGERNEVRANSAEYTLACGASRYSPW